MFNRILVAMDGSEISDRVFEEAISLAKVNRARLMLMHVFLLPDAEDITLSEYSSFYLSETESDTEEKELLEKAKQQCLGRLRMCHRDVTLAGIQADIGLLEGDPGQQICNVALKWGADLILMGHRSSTGQDAKVMVSTSNYVLHHAPCSMHIV